MRSLSFLLLSLAVVCVSSSSSVSADEGVLSMSPMMESAQPNLYDPSLQSQPLSEASLPLEQSLPEMNQLVASPSKKVHLPPLAAKQPEFQELPSKTLAPIFTKPVINTHIETQKIYAPRKVHQPVIQERLVEKPIIQRRMLYQPVIRRIVNQRIIQPKLIQTTELEKQVEERRVVQPRILRQNIVVQQLQKEVENRIPTTNKATVTALPPTKRPTRVLGEGMEMMPQQEMMMGQQYPVNEMMETAAVDMDDLEANHHSSSEFEVEADPEDVDADFETEGLKKGGFGGFGFGGLGLGFGFGGFGFPGFGFGVGFPGFGFW